MSCAVGDTVWFEDEQWTVTESCGSSVTTIHIKRVYPRGNQENVRCVLISTVEDDFVNWAMEQYSNARK